jgi:uncharacterized repeat protein (TIGR03803 family)
MQGKRLYFGLGAAMAIFAVTLVTSPGAVAQVKVIYSFGSYPDGMFPNAGLVEAKGIYYGTTSTGGANGQGAVYSLTPPSSPNAVWTEQVIYSFSYNASSNGLNGWDPCGNLTADPAGNLYGTTPVGGKYANYNENQQGYGTVYELTPAGAGTWTETVIYNFTLPPDGNDPCGGMAFDQFATSPTLYGTTEAGGTSGTAFGTGYGTVFTLTEDVADGTWTEAVVHNFAGAPSDGAYPNAGVIFDSKGNLYGTTPQGGAHDGGTVFELTQSGDLVLLHNFNNLVNQGSPNGSLTFDAELNLYGTTVNGGLGFGGSVFELTPPTQGVLWNESPPLRTFNPAKPSGGLYPGPGLCRNSSGNIYGTTQTGGAYSGGTVFELVPPPPGGTVWTGRGLHSFNPDNGDGFSPQASLILGSDGNCYGTTAYGGQFGVNVYNGYGTVFEVKP